jgi:hypothetical protein
MISWTDLVSPSKYISPMGLLHLITELSALTVIPTTSNDVRHLHATPTTRFVVNTAGSSTAPVIIRYISTNVQTMRKNSRIFIISHRVSRLQNDFLIIAILISTMPLAPSAFKPSGSRTPTCAKNICKSASFTPVLCKVQSVQC